MLNGNINRRQDGHPIRGTEEPFLPLRAKIFQSWLPILVLVNTEEFTPESSIEITQVPFCVVAYPVIKHIFSYRALRCRTVRISRRCNNFTQKHERKDSSLRTSTSRTTNSSGYCCYVINNALLSVCYIYYISFFIFIFSRFFPYYVYNLVAGLDEDGKGAVFSYDPVGSYDRDEMKCAGSAASLIQPFLDNQIGRQHIAVSIKYNVDDE